MPHTRVVDALKVGGEILE